MIWTNLWPLLALWALPAAALWILQSDARCGLLEITWRDRAVALLWLPLLILLGVWSLLLWIYDGVKRLRRPAGHGGHQPKPAPGASGPGTPPSQGSSEQRSNRA